jgi:hypothetical protein
MVVSSPSRAEVFLDFNPVPLKGEFSIEDSDYGDAKAK